ncbi:hypothetical protein L6164_022273 [Bauhinia variegata]|uniref:Uncharacterized protein n=1 Tax=Bauhinia variegata TaxID=167791 RepID=A0ACB9MF39_BAUVA|nr:hypothetical protein L6164_022273 [Bauhinia variegata]
MAQHEVDPKYFEERLRVGGAVLNNAPLLAGDERSDRLLYTTVASSQSGRREAYISYAYFSLGSTCWKRISFTLAALTQSNCSRTSRRVWDDEGVILLCALRRSRSSDIWRLCRVSVGLSLDYG